MHHKKSKVMIDPTATITKEGAITYILWLPSTQGQGRVGTSSMRWHKYVCNTHPIQTASSLCNYTVNTLHISKVEGFQHNYTIIWSFVFAPFLILKLFRKTVRGKIRAVG